MTEYEGCLAAMAALEDAYEAVFAAVRVGATAEEIDRVMLGRLAAHRAEMKPPRSTPFVVAANGTPPKLRLNRVPLRAGALWAMDNTVRRDGFCADLGRYGWFGALPPELRLAHQAVLDRQDAIAAEARPGRGMRSIYDALPHDLPFEVHRIASEGNMLPTTGNATAGVLTALDESDRRQLVFEPGQVICIEIWAGLSGGIEDMYQVEDGGVRRISTLPREIREMKE